MMKTMFKQLQLATQQFYRYAALRWPEETQWVQEQFRQLPPFQQYSSENLIKEFTKYGIEDFRVPMPIDKEENEDLALSLINELRKNVFKLSQYIDCDSEENIKLGYQVAEISSAIKNSVNNINFNPEKLVIYTNVQLGKTKFESGTSIFKLYQAIQKKVPSFDFKLPNLDTLQSFKEYSKRPKNFWIIFSTQLNDLAGIASRGIMSCQNLAYEPENELLAKLQKRMVGTILSKYIGVIYLTSGSNYEGLGDKMLYRCLVRVMLDTKDGKTKIGLDAMLPYKNDICLTVFKQELEKRSSVPVVILGSGTACEFDGLEDAEEIDPEYASYQEYPLAKSKMLNSLLNSEDPQERIIGVRRLHPEDPKLVEIYLEDEDEKVRNEAYVRMPVYILETL